MPASLRAVIPLFCSPRARPSEGLGSEQLSDIDTRGFIEEEAA